MAYEKRSDIPEKYKWDMTLAFKSVEDFEKEREAITNDIEGLERFKGKLISEKKLVSALDEIMDIERRIENAYVYASHSSDLDTRDSEWQNRVMQMYSVFALYKGKIAYLRPELLSYDREEVFALLSDDKYERFLDDIFRFKEHTLTEAEEKILAAVSEVTESSSKVYSDLTNADLTFPTIKDSEGKDLTLTQGNFVPTLMSLDRDLRERAFKAFYSVFEGHKNTVSTTLHSTVKNHVIQSRLRKFPSARAMSLAENNVPESVYDALIDAVHDALPAMYKYLEIRKKVLGVDQLHMYDVYAPLIKEKAKEISFEEARVLVENALKPMGEDYMEKIEEAFNNRWIDVYETPGKRSGAYSGGAFDMPPYLLLNHQDTLDSAFTLAHELGHSMHSYYSRTNQPYVNSGYSIFLAEIASTFNEALLNHYLLSTETDKEVRRSIINNYLDAFKGTIFRQTMFAEFERDIHKIVEEGGTLTSDLLNERYHKLNELYFGPEMFVDKEIDYEWSRIPHFYYNFYVFQYATGMSAATAFAKRIINKEEGALEAYKGFLKAGCSKYPLEVLKDAGLDMTDPNVVREALETFKEMVSEFEQLL
ncbi:oligoendopeptidase F [Guggenheimella bovis]